MSTPPTVFEEFTDPVDGTRWRVDVGFLSSNWHCIWGEGCQGILDEPAEELGQGCCSVGVEVFDEDEAMQLSTLAATIEPGRWQWADVAATDGIFRDERCDHTALVDGACIFLNRPGYAAGAGCVLHLQAVADGDRPIDAKPTVCWQLPLWTETAADGARVLRRWGRADWGADASMAWCCTEAPEPYSGAVRTADELSAELDAILGPEVSVEVRRRCAAPPAHPR